MAPNLPLPTDNVYKFACIFGLALIVAAVFSYVSIHSSSLDRKIRYSESVITLEAKGERTKADNDLLELNRRLLEVTKSNESAASHIVSAVLGIGVALSLAGAWAWYTKIQARDNKLADLQVRKLAAEVARLEAVSSGHPSQAGSSRSGDA